MPADPQTVNYVNSYQPPAANQPAADQQSVADRQPVANSQSSVGSTNFNPVTAKPGFSPSQSPATDHPTTNISANFATTSSSANSAIDYRKMAPNRSGAQSSLNQLGASPAVTASNSGYQPASTSPAVGSNFNQPDLSAPVSAPPRSPIAPPATTTNDQPITADQRLSELAKKADDQLLAPVQPAPALRPSDQPALTSSQQPVLAPVKTPASMPTYQSVSASVATQPAVTTNQSTAVNDSQPVSNFSATTKPSETNKSTTADDQEDLASQNIFELLGVNQGSDQEKESFLDELQQVIWEDFLDKDLELLVTSTEKQDVDQILADKNLDDLAKQEKIVTYLEKIIPDLEEIMLDKALQLKKELVGERVSAMQSSFTNDPPKLAQVEQAAWQIGQGKWRSGAKILNQLSQ